MSQAHAASGGPGTSIDAGLESARWQRLSPKLASVRRNQLLALGIPLLIAGVGAGAAGGGVLGAVIGAVVALVLAAIGWWVMRRRIRAWGYAEREDDLLVRRGVMFKRLSIIPYGRMQYIDVTSGPFERSYGLATVRMYTAAAASDARIPGLPADEAARLRDSLTELGEARAAGL